MSSLLAEEDLVDEVELIWAVPSEIAALDYVRQSVQKVSRRKGRPRYVLDGRCLGWANLGEDAEPDPDSGLYKRRIFFLLPHDRDSDPDGVYATGAPGEAVDPRTLEPRKVGEKTPRSQHKSAPAAAH